MQQSSSPVHSQAAFMPYVRNEPLSDQSGVTRSLCSDTQFVGQTHAPFGSLGGTNGHVAAEDRVAASDHVDVDLSDEVSFCRLRHQRNEVARPDVVRTPVGRLSLFGTEGDENTGSAAGRASTARAISRG